VPLMSELLDKVREARRLQSESEGRIDFGPAYERYVAAAADMDWKAIEQAVLHARVLDNIRWDRRP